MTIFVITTGGTIGALAYNDPENPPPYITNPAAGKDYVQDVLLDSFSSIKTRCHTMPTCDSKLMDKDYREEILLLIEDAPEKSVLITHGTDAILDTADFLNQSLKTRPKLKEKTLVLTGAMIPLANGKISDGYLNLAFSLDRLVHAQLQSSVLTIVLCDYDKDGHWKPHAYTYKPKRYFKYFDKDGRYSRLKEMSQP